MSESISRIFARWAGGLSYEDLPDAVVDKIKAIILLAGHSALLGSRTESSRNVASIFGADDANPNGATLLTTGEKVSRQSAALINTKFMESAGLWDSYRMITHPAAALVAVALANAEIEGRSGKEVITALAAGYEFLCRLANDHVPSVAAQGFRPAPIFAVMGASVVAGKLLGHDEEKLVATIAIAANGAAGLNESGRSGATDITLHDPVAARHGVFAALAADALPGKASERIIEGDAGFLRAYAGSSTGKLSYVFEGPSQIDLGKITARLGKEYLLTDVMFRMYNTAGFNQPVIELMSELKQMHAFDPDDIASVEVHMNYLETQYPSPQFPRDAWRNPGVASTHFFAAYAAVYGSYPQVGETESGTASKSTMAQDKRVVDFMTNKVKLVPRYDYPMFSPTIQLRFVDGRIVSEQYLYERMTWDFAQVVERLGRSRTELRERERHADAWRTVVARLETIDHVELLIDALDTTR